MSKSRDITLQFNTVNHKTKNQLELDCNGFVLLDAIYHYSFNHLNNSGWCYASKETLANIVGVSRPTIFRYLKTFEEKGFIERQDDSGRVRTTDYYNRVFMENKNKKDEPSQNDTISINPPKQYQNDTTLSQNDTIDSIKMRPNIYSNKNKDIKTKNIVGKYPYKVIIEDLNKQAKTKYRHTSEATQELIRARINEGYTVEDFKKVHSNKCAGWLDSEMAKFLRPSTLYMRKHFDEYLNEVVSKKDLPAPKCIDCDSILTYRNYKGRVYCRDCYPYEKAEQI